MLRYVWGAALLLAGLALNPAQAQAPAGDRMYLVAYFETGAAAANEAAGQLGQFAAASRKADGNLGFEALREEDRPGRFAILEVWRDKAAADAYAAAESGFREKLQPLLSAPFDIRTCIGLEVNPTAAPAPATALYVLTHVDVIPAGKDDTIALLRQLTEASRKQNSVARFDVIQQPNRPNHLFLIEAWLTGAARGAHVVAAPTHEFRDKLVQYQGALYDERLYRPIR
jgi:quinol monooxygenase YgiN